MTDAPAPMRLLLARVEYSAVGTHLFEFRRTDGRALPSYEPGAHVDVHLPGGLIRQYSIVDPPADGVHRYVVGIKRDPKSRGGSVAAHDRLRVGAMVEVGAPRNHFPLDEQAAHSVFVAGGIGITPIACMVQRLRARGRPWSLHYAVRTRAEAALLDRVGGPGLHLHVDDEQGGALLDVAALVATLPPSASVYCCGPQPLIDAFEAAVRRRPELPWFVEHFAPAAPVALDGGFSVRLVASDKTVLVPPGQTILEAVRAVGVRVPSSCEQGICGTCETTVLAGTPDHRDSLLSDEEKRSNKVMMICCSGSLGPELVLDL
jgi:ferredoxin-NADP reductase